MSKNLKKILVTGASLLMFASVGAGINSNDNSASANVALTSESQYRKIRGARVIATRPHGSRRPFGDNTTLGYVNGNSVIVNGNGEVTRIDGRRATRSLFNRVFYHHTARRRTRRHYRRPVRRRSHRAKYYSKGYIKKYFAQMNHHNVPRSLTGEWFMNDYKSISPHTIVFKPFTRRTMNKLLKRGNTKLDSQIIKNNKLFSSVPPIKHVGHNQYAFVNPHKVVDDFYVSYKVTILNHDKIKISNYGKGDHLAPVPLGIYIRLNNSSQFNNSAYGISAKG